MGGGGGREEWDAEHGREKGGRNYRCALGVHPGRISDTVPPSPPTSPRRSLQTGYIRAFGVSSAKRFDLEACLALFTWLTRSTLRQARDRGQGNTRGRRVDLQGTGDVTYSGRLVCINLYARRGHGYVCILINTLLTPRPGNINHKTMENGVAGRRRYSGI